MVGAKDGDGSSRWSDRQPRDSVLLSVLTNPDFTRNPAGKRCWDRSECNRLFSSTIMSPACNIGTIETLQAEKTAALKKSLLKAQFKL